MRVHCDKNKDRNLYQKVSTPPGGHTDSERGANQDSSKGHDFSLKSYDG